MITICMITFMIAAAIMLMYSMILHEQIPLWLWIVATVCVILMDAHQMTKKDHGKLMSIVDVIEAGVWGYWTLNEYSKRGKATDIAKIKERWQIMRELDNGAYTDAMKHYKVSRERINIEIDNLETAEINDKLKYW